MSIGTLSRANLYEVLVAVLAEALSGAQHVGHIRLDAVPQGIADRGFAIESIGSRDDTARRSRSSDLLKRYTVAVRYAKRMGVAHDTDADRIVAMEDLDGMERALRQSDAPNTAEFSCDTFTTSERIGGDGEWLLVDITAEILCQLRLRSPDAPAEGLT